MRIVFCVRKIIILVFRVFVIVKFLVFLWLKFLELILNIDIFFRFEVNRIVLFLEFEFIMINLFGYIVCCLIVFRILG